MPQHAPVRVSAGRKRGEPEVVHLTERDGLACHGRGSWQTISPGKVTCPGCRQSGAFQKMLTQARTPIETRDDPDDAIARQMYWAGHLRKMGLHHAQGVGRKRIRTSTGPTWGIFISPWEDAEIEYVPD